MTAFKGYKGRPKLKPRAWRRGGAKAKTGRKTPRRASRRSPVVGEEHKLRVNVPDGKVSRMPAFAIKLDDAEIWAVIAFIKSFWSENIGASEHDC